ncbi:MAG: SRPBCC family protein [Hyphomicrobiaceae bacterium]
MPSISEKTTIPSPPEQVWPLLSDPALVASCIPGATLSPDQDGGDTWKGSIRVKFGPTVAVFRGEATLDYDHAARKVTIQGRGIDQRGASRALANGVVTATGTDTTTLTVDGEYTVSGPLETFANAGGVHVARALLAEFSTNMAKMVAERGSTAEAAADAGATAALPEGDGAMPAAAAHATAAPAAAPKPAAAPPPAAAAELSATKLLWRAFLSWLSSLFGKRT